MAIAAVPNYLGIDFEQASPGMRFGMYLPLWGVDSENSMPLWTTHDVNYRATGQRNEMRRFEDKNKTVALSRALPLSRNDLLTMAALAKRQSAIAAPLADLGCLLIMHGLAVAPFTTGLGNEHPLENGFAFLNPYGLPYLAGSGIKGVMRQAARELASHDWGDNKGWNHAAITALFGKTSANGENDLQSGALMFWDVIPQIEGDKLQVEVMTPHQSHYYQNGQSPHESGQPNPINFLVVPPGSKFEFHVQCDLSFLGRLMPDLAIDGRWQNLLVAALSHAFEWLGFGAKTAVGYGAMREDEKAGEERERQTQLRRETTA
jgi:CRISPR-associated protein Cmr6